MVSMSNGGACDANPNIRSLENGCCSSSHAELKYKPRKVSAVRDFPPGCGRNAPPLDLKPQETVGLPTETAAVPQKTVAVAPVNDTNNSVAWENSANIQQENGIEACDNGGQSFSDDVVKLEPRDTLDDLVANVAASAGIVHGVELSPKLDLQGVDSPLSLVGNAPSLSKKPTEEKVQALMKHSDVTEKKTVLEMGSVAAGVVPPCGAEAFAPSKRFIDKCNGPEETSIKIKYCRRRVSASRDFPPFCGRNAPSPSEEERLKIVGGNKSFGHLEKSSGHGGPMREVVKADVGGSEVTAAGRTGFEEIIGEVPYGNAEMGEKGSVSWPKTKSDKAPVQDGTEGGIVVATMGNSPVRETVKSTVEILSGDLQDGNLRKQELEGSKPRPKTKSSRVTGKSGEHFSFVKEEVCEVGQNWEKGHVSELQTPSNKAVVQGGTLRESLTGDLKGKPVKEIVQGSAKEMDGDLSKRNLHKRKLEGGLPGPKMKSTKINGKCNDHGEGVGKEIVLYSSNKSVARRASVDAVALGHDVDRVIVYGLMAAPNCPWRQGKAALGTSHGPATSKPKSVGRQKSHEAGHSEGKSMEKKLFSPGKAAYEHKGELFDKDEGDLSTLEQHQDSSAGKRPADFEVTLPPFGPNASNHGDARNRVRETLRLFQAICRKLLQGEEAKSGQQGNLRRIDLQAANIIKEKRKEVNTGSQIIGSVPGVEVGDEFQYRVELVLVGVHRLYQAGIDYMKQGGTIIAASIVASGGYADSLDNPDILIYSGQGGFVPGSNKQPEDQKLERGNLALLNSISAKNPVRVIHGSKETKSSNSEARAKIASTYTYDGLYLVERYWHEMGQHGKLVYKFELKRIPGQPELAWKEVKKMKKFRVREGLCDDDISQGKEVFPICAVNTMDNEKPPTFTYIINMKYPDRYSPIPPEGCDCIGGCLDSRKCSCVVKNGGEIPFNHNGAIVEAKPLIYECGPSCKCPPPCNNRVSQHGMKIQLEIFKTKSRGWGVRSLTSIPSGSFLCEYMGELLEDKEAEKRYNDEYLFDIGQNYSDCFLRDDLDTIKLDAQSTISEVIEDGGYTIDAAQYGNIGRFINHSCSPNLYAQNVLYDHDDKRMPHIMLFAAENIPPLQELTYHYNYSVDGVHDSNGNIKMKSCYCGSAECTGRMY